MSSLNSCLQFMEPHFSKYDKTQSNHLLFSLPISLILEIVYEKHESLLLLLIIFLFRSHLNLVDFINVSESRYPNLKRKKICLQSCYMASEMVSYSKGGSRLSLFENRIMRKIFGPERDENGEWKRLHNEELHSLCRTPNIVRTIISQRLRRVGHIVRI